jgi:SAM-dependent methyltransferase
VDFDDLLRDFSNAPAPWSEGQTIPWNDPEFSRRMLHEHLSQSHDGASRKQETIDRHVEFIKRVALPDRPARILDLGCGPGLYAARLSEAGHHCHGIDFSPASIDYAIRNSGTGANRPTYELGDIRTAPFPDDYDLVMLLFGELNVFPRDEAVSLLARCRDALAPNGLVLLEVHTLEFIKNRGSIRPTWSAWKAGLFSDEPHLRLEESFWLDDVRIAAGRHWITYPGSTLVERYGWNMQAYNDHAYTKLLTDAGLELRERYSSLTGEEDAAGLPVLVARAKSM